MQRFTNPSVLLIAPRVFGSERLTASIAQEPSVDFLGHVENLNKAYNLTETEQPDLVIVAATEAAAPEFPMYFALLDMLRVRCVVLQDERLERRLTAPANIVTMAEIEAAGGLGPWVVRGYLKPVAPSPEPNLTSSEAVHALNPGDGAGSSAYRRAWKTVVIGASTGGIEALLEVLSHYREDCPPTLIVQHIGAAYVPGLVQRLDRHCAAVVEIATPASRIRPGRVLLAPGGGEHLTILPPGRHCRLLSSAPVSGHRPSVDVLFHSAAKLSPDVVGVILTGMGRDGAEGLAAIRHAGGRTIGQDEASSTVYGMPRAAWTLGAVQQQLSLRGIGPALLDAASADDDRKSHARSR